MSKYITGKTANEVWKTAMELLLQQETLVEGRSGNVFELLHTFITIEEPKQRWIYNRIPPLSIAFALAELVWIVNGEERADVINFWNPSLPKYAGEGDIYHGAYGKRIRSHVGFDQLEATYNALQENSQSRQVVIQIYDSKVDFPIDKGQPRDKDIPCNVCSLLKVRGGKLEWSQIMRSNDIFSGMPYDFVQFTCLQEILAGWLELECGSYSHYSDSLHLYESDLKKIEIGKIGEIKCEESLALCKNESERIFKMIYERMKLFALSKVSEKEIFTLSQIDCGYEAYSNIMLIIGMYVANKMQYGDVVKELMKKCTNNIYVIMWENWLQKKSRFKKE